MDKYKFISNLLYLVAPASISPGRDFARLAFKLQFIALFATAVVILSEA